MKNKSAILIFLLLVIIIFIIPTGDVEKVRLDRTYEGPSREFIMGTDNLGRDFYSLFIEGGKRTIIVTILASLVAITIGVPSGLIAGYYEGKILGFIRFIADLLMVIPSFVLALIFTSIFGLTPVSAGIMLGITSAPSFMYQTMSLTKKIKKEDFFQNEKILGIKGKKIVFNHILPHIIDPVMTSLGNNAGSIIINYASLSFIGLGTDVTTPDWGAMLYQYRIHMIEYPRLIVIPTLGIFTLAYLFNIIFDSESFLSKKRGSMYE